MAIKAMEKSTASVLLLAVIGYQLQEVTGQQCSATGINGINGCQCNFMEACDTVGNPKSNWDQYLPTGVDQYGLVKSRQRNLAYLCEDEAVAILYDCNSRIPLYAATVMDGTQLLAPDYGRRTSHFRQNLNQLDKRFLQGDMDYAPSSKRDVCYSAQANTRKPFQPTKSHRPKKRPRPRIQLQPTKRTCPGKPQVKIQRGHMIASQYGRGNQSRIRATFTYTNVVPQFSVFNQGPWRVCEGRLISWGNQNCAEVKGATNVQLFIVVGAIPSTVFPASEQRYFGKGGFFAYQDDEHYRVNMPKYMWTAACCKYDINGTLKYHSTAFYKENNPGNGQCNREFIDALSRRLSDWVRQTVINAKSINLFPQTPQCNSQSNYVALP